MSNARISKHIGLSVIGASVLGVLLSASPNDARVADAAMAGDREVVKSLLKQGADVNAAQGDGTTPLHWAARRGDVELAQMLIYAGANVRATTRLGGWTPLLMAAQLGHPKMIETLLNAGLGSENDDGIRRDTADAGVRGWQSRGRAPAPLERRGRQRRRVRPR